MERAIAGSMTEGLGAHTLRAARPSVIECAIVNAAARPTICLPATPHEDEAEEKDEMIVAREDVLDA